MSVPACDAQRSFVAAAVQEGQPGVAQTDQAQNAGVTSLTWARSEIVLHADLVGRALSAVRRADTGQPGYHRNSAL